MSKEASKLQLSCTYHPTMIKGVNFINFIRTHFLYERRFGSFSYYINVTREKLPKQCLYEKFVCKMLMKLITDLRIRNFDYSKTQKSQAKVKVIFLD